MDSELRYWGDMSSISNLAIAVTFFYKKDRLIFLDTISDRFQSLADRVHIYLVTNTYITEENNSIIAVLKNKNVPFSIHRPKLLGHPYLLPWCHFELFRSLLNNDPSVSHFMYIEDDTLVTCHNVEYWLQGRLDLKEHGLIPSFLRYEKNDNGDFYIVDIIRQAVFDSAPKIYMNDGYCYMNMPNSYQGMYLLDRELMVEHMSGPSSNPDSGRWHIRETATQGLTFAKVPAGFTTRNLVGFFTDSFTVDPRCLIHHTANTYVSRPQGPLARISLHNLVIRNEVNDPV